MRYEAMGLIILISGPAHLPLALASSGAFYPSGIPDSEAQCTSGKQAGVRGYGLKSWSTSYRSLLASQMVRAGT